MEAESWFHRLSFWFLNLTQEIQNPCSSAAYLYDLP